jgi:CheY-like chemotaxis protein
MGVLLHVEDEDAVAAIFRAALDAAGLAVTVCRVSNGEEALEYLRRGAFSSTPERPDVVFLDLNMPKMDGWQVLSEMQADQSLRSIPVVVLSTASRPSDINRAFGLGARHYIAKPSFFDDWITELESACGRFVARPARGRLKHWER